MKQRPAIATPTTSPHSISASRLPDETIPVRSDLPTRQTHVHAARRLMAPSQLGTLPEAHTALGLPLYTQATSHSGVIPISRCITRSSIILRMAAPCFRKANSKSLRPVPRPRLEMPAAASARARDFGYCVYLRGSKERSSAVKSCAPSTADSLSSWTRRCCSSPLTMRRPYPSERQSESASTTSMPDATR